MFGAGEDDRPPHRAVLQKVHQERALPVVIDRVADLRDVGHGGRRRRDLDLRRPYQHLPGQFHNRRRHGRREHHGLALGRHRRHDAPDVLDEPHVEHPIGLVQHEDFQRVEAHRLSLEVIQQPPRGRHDDVHPAPQRQLLRTVPDTAEDDGGLEWKQRAVGLHRFADLRRQLARGGQDQRPRRRGAAPRQALEDGQHKPGGLARAGLRAAEKVASRQRERNRPLLDGGRRLIACPFDGLNEFGPKAQLQKRHTDSFLCGRSRGRAGRVGNAGLMADGTRRRTAFLAETRITRSWNLKSGDEPCEGQPTHIPTGKGPSRRRPRGGREHRLLVHQCRDYTTAHAEMPLNNLLCVRELQSDISFRRSGRPRDSQPDHIFTQEET